MIRLDFKELSKILHNSDAIKLIEFLIVNENKKFSIIEISEKSGISISKTYNYLEILQNFVVKKYAKNYRARTGIIAIPKLDQSFKEFYLKLKNDMKLV